MAAKIPKIRSSPLQPHSVPGRSNLRATSDRSQFHIVFHRSFPLPWVDSMHVSRTSITIFLVQSIFFVSGVIRCGQNSITSWHVRWKQASVIPFVSVAPRTLISNMPSYRYWGSCYCDISGFPVAQGWSDITRLVGE